MIKKKRHFFIITSLVAFFFAFDLLALSEEILAGETTRVSVSSTGVQGNDQSDYTSISEDGRLVAFQSTADNLASGDSNGVPDIFVHDRQTGETTLVSVSSTGVQGNNSSDRPSISAEGRFVAFGSNATNLVSNDSNGLHDIFVHDRQTGETTLVSVSSTGVQGNDGSFNPSISADGRFVVFRSRASNLVSNDSNGLYDIFVHDRQTGETTRVSVSSTGVQGNGHCLINASISADGRFVAFGSLASNLVQGDSNGGLGNSIGDDAFVHDRQTGETTLVSVSSNGVQGNTGIDSLFISANGRFVAFSSNSDNLVPDDTNGVQDVFVHDRQTGETTLVSVSSTGVQGNDGSGPIFLSEDGRLVAFQSTADNLASGDSNGVPDIFVHDRQTGETTRVSVSSTGVQGNDNSFRPFISADGRFIAFSSRSDNLVPDDTNGVLDIFVHDRGQQISPTIAQLPTSGPPGTTFTQWGTGFTPNSTGKLYTRNPDLSELYIRDVAMDETGHFEIPYESATDKVPGTYSWWIVDGGPAETKSNEVSYEITEPQPVQVTLTMSLDPQTGGGVVTVPPDEVCETTCVYNYDSGTQVELTASAYEGWDFECWSDGANCISTENPYLTVIETDRVITAKFVEVQVQPRSYFALLVGVNDNVNKTLEWPYGKNNVRDLKKALLSYKNWEDDDIHIRTLENKNATKDNIINEIKIISELMKPNDLLLFYFNGHGFQPDYDISLLTKAMEKIRDFFIIIGSDKPWDKPPFDEDEDNKDEWLVTYGKQCKDEDEKCENEEDENWIRDDKLKDFFVGVPNVVAIIHSCFSDGVAQDIVTLPNVATLSASEESETMNTSYISDRIIDSIKKFTDYDGDDKLSLKEVYQYVSDVRDKFWFKRNISKPVHRNPYSIDEIIAIK